MVTPQHQMTTRLEGLVYALDVPSHSKVRAQHLPVYDLVPNGNPPLQVVDGFRRQVRSVKRGLPKSVVSLEVEFHPFEEKSAPPQDRERFPTYVLRIRQPRTSEQPEVVGKQTPAPIYDRKAVESVFSGLLSKKNLRIQQFGKFQDTCHWNLNHRSKGNLYAVRREGNHLVLIASDANDLLELADHYFHYAQPQTRELPAARTNNLLRATVYVDGHKPSSRMGRGAKAAPPARKPSLPASHWFRQEIRSA